MKIWKIAGVLSLCMLAGCGNLSAADEQQLKDGLQDASQQLGSAMEQAGEAWDKAQAEIEAEMSVAAGVVQEHSRAVSVQREEAAGRGEEDAIF